ncbi:hypothetical protein B0H17DRAFT_1111267 [Mycena rosella]|uniref:Uncharacterized protein n=1 Tax=Mycena rosella TaxID=1033263 RepID=A0AAD7BMV9_MYCRO|nr:hypothetical protein B0H17DRAFT_1111267 [Mycena rosella]
MRIRRAWVFTKGRAQWVFQDAHSSMRRNSPEPPRAQSSAPQDLGVLVSLTVPSFSREPSHLKV